MTTEFYDNANMIRSDTKDFPYESIISYTIICPYCGYKCPDPSEEEPGQEDIGELVCSHCEQDFYATRNVSITYSTEIMSNDNDER